jgi:uncharacterized protein
MSGLKIIITFVLCTVICSKGFSKLKVNRFNVIVLAENKGSIHRPYVDVAIPWLNKLAADSSFSVDVIENTEKIDDQFLLKYQLIIQLDFPPYMWSDKSKAAFEKYIEEGRGGWIGFHHATLLGEFDGYAMWQWFSKFMGGIRYENYISTFVKANVIVEDSTHPCMKGISNPFTIEKEEFYIYNKSPRENVHVLAHADEDSYSPDSKIKMGDHPVIWTNEKVKARNIYIFMGHHPGLFQNDKYKQLFRNAIFWAAKKG